MGLLPLILAVARVRFRRGNIRVRWLSLTLLLAVLASTGDFGPGWIARGIAGLGQPEGQVRAAGDFPVGDAFGGLYWLKVVAFPGFSGFRYPAKEFTLGALAIAILGAYGWDDLRRVAFRR